MGAQYTEAAKYLGSAIGPAISERSEIKAGASDMSDMGCRFDLLIMYTAIMSGIAVA